MYLECCVIAHHIDADIKIWLKKIRKNSFHLMKHEMHTKLFVYLVGIHIYNFLHHVVNHECKTTTT